jgi:aspartate/methionine/tyrosine aminotransferase
LRGDATHYNAAGGGPALREATAAFLSRTRPALGRLSATTANTADTAANTANTTNTAAGNAGEGGVNPDHVLVMPGGKPIIFHTIATLCEEGNEVIIHHLLSSRLLLRSSSLCCAWHLLPL